MRVYLDKNERKAKGLALKFPFSSDDVNHIKTIPGVNWDRIQRAWISEGPEILLDMQRFRVDINGMSPAARQICEEFRSELWDIMDIRAEDHPEMYGYQIQGTKILARSSHFLLADDMGLGKTKQVLDAIACLGLSRVLVLAPKTLTYNWLAEVQKWHPELTAEVVPDHTSGTKKKKRKDFWEDPPSIVIANYEKIQLKDWPIDISWQAVVADECTRLKNSKTLTHKKVKTIVGQSERFWPMTGTPLENHLVELYNIMATMRPSVLGNYIRFRNQHMNMDWAGHIIGSKNIQLLRERIGPFMLRRTKSEVLTQLPPKVYAQNYVKMSPREQSEYQKLIMEFEEWSKEHNIAGGSSPLTQTIRMRQFCCSPHVLDPWLPRGSKYEALLEVLSSHEGKALIFCYFEEATRLLAAWLEKDVGYNPEAYISGPVPSQERLRRVDAFNAGRLGNIFISTDAGREGINLTAADLVIHYSQLWNPQQMRQREDRTHRIGQHKSVTVVDLLYMDSIDVGMWELNREREKLFEEVIEGAEEAMLRKLSPARLRRVIEGRLRSGRRSDD